MIISGLLSVLKTVNYIYFITTFLMNEGDTGKIPLELAGNHDDCMDHDKVDHDRVDHDKVDHDKVDHGECTSGRDTGDHIDPEDVRG